MDKKTFLLYRDLILSLDELDYSQLGEAFWGVLQFVNGEEPEIVDPVARMAYKFMVTGIAENDRKWQEKADRCKAAATARWEQKKDLPAATDKP